MAQVGDTVTVMIDNIEGQMKRRYDATVIEKNPEHNEVILETTFGGEEHELGEAELEVGDRLVIRFYDDRLYNVVEIHDKDADTLEGWYCNFLRSPQITNGFIKAQDLEMGLFVRPEHPGTLVTHRDAYEMLDIQPAEREIIEEELAGLLQAAAENIPPFGGEMPTRTPPTKQMPGPEENLAKDPKRDIHPNNPRTDR